MKLKTIGLVGLFACFLLTGLTSGQNATDASDEQVVVARGVGAIIGGDEAKAEDDALASALRSAVEQVIGTMIQSEVLVQNYQTVEDNIYSHTQGYVKNYNVISKSKKSDTILEVAIQATVKKADLKNDLEAIGLLIARKGKPRLMVIIDEKNLDDHYYSWAMDMNTSENAFMNIMLQKGFPFVDREVAMRKLKKDEVLAALSGDEQAAQSIGLEAGAELLILGKAVSKEASGGPAVVRQSGMVSCQATMNLRAVRADDGQILATTSQQAAAAHIDRLMGGTNALKRTAEMAAQDLSSKIIDRWQKDVYSGTTINLRLMNVATFSDLVKVKNMLPVMIRGVQKVYQRDYTQQTALFELDVRGTASGIAEELVMKDLSPYSIEVINVTQNTIVAKLVNK